MEGQWEKSQRLTETAYRMIENKVNFPCYNTTIISVFILIISLLYNLEEYEELIKCNASLKDFQEK